MRKDVAPPTRRELLLVAGSAAALTAATAGADRAHAQKGPHQSFVTVLDHGAVGDGSNDDTSALQAAIDAAQGTGGTVVFPHTPQGYRISAPLTIAEPVGILFVGGVKIVQATAKRGVFDIETTAAGTQFDGNCHLVLEPARVWDPAKPSWREDVEFIRASGVYVAADDVRIGGTLVAENLAVGVFLSNWRSSTGASDPGGKTGRRRGCTIEDVVSIGCEQGVLAINTEGCAIGRVRGTYHSTPGTDQPSHLVYVSDNHNGDSPTEDHHLDLTIGHVAGWRTDPADDAKPGHVLSYKGVTGGTVGSVSARNCHGALTVLDCRHFSIGSIVSRADRGCLETGSVFVQLPTLADGTKLKPEVAHGHIGSIRLEMAAQRRAVTIRATDFHVGEIQLETARTSNTSLPDVALSGTRVTVGLLKAINRGALGSRLLDIGAPAGPVSSGDGHVAVGDLQALGSFHLVARIRAAPTDAGGNTTEDRRGSRHAQIRYDPANLAWGSEDGRAPGSNAVPFIVEEPSARLHPSPARKVLTVTGTAPSVTADPSLASHLVISVKGAGAALTIQNPALATEGLRLCYELRNDSGGALGSVTWAAGHRLLPGWLPGDAPGPGERRCLEFAFDGTHWIEVSRTGIG